MRFRSSAHPVYVFMKNAKRRSLNRFPNLPRHASRSPALHARMACRQTTVKVEREEGSENTVTVTVTVTVFRSSDPSESAFPVSTP